MERIQVRIIASIAELASVRPYWDSWSGSISSNLDRFIDEIDALEFVLRPHVIVFERQDVPVALVAAREVHSIPPWKFGYYNPLWRRKRYLQVVRDGLLGDFSSDGMGETLLEGLAQSLQKSKLPFIHFKEMEADHLAHGFLMQSAPPLQRDPIDEKDVHWTTVLPPSLADFYRTRSKTIRRNTKRYREKLDKQFPGKVTLHTFDSLDQCIEDIMRIVQLSYQARLGVGFQATPEQIQICRKSSERGRLRVYLLHVGDKAVAFQIGHILKGTFFAESTSFDPDYRSARPGACLLMHIIEEFCGSTDVSRIDWGYGRATYKEELGTDCGLRANYYFFAPTAYGQAMRLLRAAIVGSHRQFKSRLDSWKLLDRVKTGWRQLGATGRKPQTAKLDPGSNAKQGGGQ